MLDGYFVIARWYIPVLLAGEWSGGYWRVPISTGGEVAKCGDHIELVNVPWEKSNAHRTHPHISWPNPPHVRTGLNDY